MKPAADCSASIVSFFFLRCSNDADKHLGVLKIFCDVDTCDCDELIDVRVAHVAMDDFRDHFFEQRVETEGAIF